MTVYNVSVKCPFCEEIHSHTIETASKTGWIASIPCSTTGKDISYGTKKQNGKFVAVVLTDEE